MRGSTTQQVEVLLALTPNHLVPQDHPLPSHQAHRRGVLKELSPIFTRMYAWIGRPSIPPEHLLKANLLIALYSIRSERQFCELLQYDLMFKWLLDLNIIDPAFDPTTFSKNRMRLLERYPSLRRLTAGADRDYDTREFAETCRLLLMTPPRSQAPALPSGSAHHPSPGIPAQPAGAQAHRGDQRQDQDDGRWGQAAVPRGGPKPVVGPADYRRLYRTENGQAARATGVAQGDLCLMIRQGQAQRDHRAPEAPPDTRDDPIQAS